MLELRGVSKSYGDRAAVRTLEFKVSEGRTTVFIGPSGCGKSTILRLMIGLVAPDSGTVLFDGVPLGSDTVLGVRRHMGYVIQEGGLFPHLTARANVTLMARYLGWSHGRRAARVDELVDLARFPPQALSRYPAELSGGQRQRVSLMRALMLDPDVLLLDEPLGALDPMIRSGLQDDLRGIFRELGKTVVLVTHDLAEAAFLGDEIVLMRGGGIVQRGTLAEMMTAPAEKFVSRFIRAQRSHLDDPARGAAS